MNLFEVVYDGLVALIYAKNEKQATKFFKETFGSFPADYGDSTFAEEFNRKDFEDSRGIYVVHMGSQPKEWNLDGKPLLAQANYRLPD